jgi:hypothetical protein
MIKVVNKMCILYLQSDVVITPSSLGSYPPLFSGCAGLCAIILCILLSILACNTVTTIVRLSNREAAKRQKVLLVTLCILTFSQDENRMTRTLVIMIMFEAICVALPCLLRVAMNYYPVDVVNTFLTYFIGS